jgi:hypothetical protein
MDMVRAITASRAPEPAKQAEDVSKLAARDREVRTHEAAHFAAAGGLAVSGPHFSYERGPDGTLYAVGGEVQIDTSPGRSLEDTLVLLC